MSLKTGSKKYDVEYSVYIFHKPVHQNDNNINLAGWERRHSTADIRLAYKQARDLYASHDYERVEIKKKFFDRRGRQNIHKTLKIFRDNSGIPVGMFILAGPAVLCVCAMAVLAWTFFY